ncbi:phosphoribosylglycinamide formyltransferase-1 [Bacteroidales bacterium KHT7]|jgi:phosphoribosylglycinamide formyltransferase-1|nr:phosphoribosylglycinamide formyltransferase [Bacteroidaceae bacterium]MBQ5476393.1 phosphoribosylglycinamide formyltransferase [Bacteroidaceae bacterium]SDF01477.1 phosphoribosylglycinamide formyltransferase-1 [Bacteroidales bacterium KHT7]
MNNKKIRLAVFVSGGGTNLENIINYFSADEQVEVSMVVSNKADAYALQRAKNHDIPNAVISRKQFAEDEATVMAAVKDCDFIILAGFLVKVPDYLIDAYPKRIINIHPALLPKYGGKGMYGHHIHEAVKAAGEKETGITIHFVNNELDAGEHIAQFKVALSDEDTADTIAAKIHELEQAHFPKVIESVIKA